MTESYRQLPSCVISHTEDGKLVMETYRNGARKREILEPGLELLAIKCELLDQSDRLRVARDHEQRVVERETLERAKREELHRRVYTITAQSHGLGFAARTIGGKKPRGLSTKPKVKEWNGLLP